MIAIGCGSGGVRGDGCGSAGAGGGWGEAFTNDAYEYLGARGKAGGRMAAAKVSDGAAAGARFVGAETRPERSSGAFGLYRGRRVNKGGGEAGSGNAGSSVGVAICLAG